MENSNIVKKEVINIIGKGVPYNNASHTQNLNFLKMNITIKVIFDFKSNEEWHNFLKNFSSHNEFEQDYSTQLNNMKKNYKTLEDLFDSVFLKCGEKREPALPCVPFIASESKERLQLLLDFIEKNHYENNYQLWVNHEKLHMTLPQLLKNIVD